MKLEYTQNDLSRLILRDIFMNNGLVPKSQKTVRFYLEQDAESEEVSISVDLEQFEPKE